ncbi:DUF6226 family protein [Pseudonocardia sp. GCM10023141]|uniref:DUF6226 family protein n=1 Tax=Pseudonocardia sp. GCM10023141 TaxID=3252653 RepID=UPI003612EBDC
MAASAGDHETVNRRWAGAPPEEAYGRVTDPGRFAALHTIAGEALDELELRYDVTRERALEPDRHSTAPAPVVRLVPRDPAAATLTVVFTAFPGLIVRLGRDDDTLYLPTCGCDACDELVEDCAELLGDYVDALATGAFGEGLTLDDGWWHERWIRTERRSSSSRSLVEDPIQLAELRAAMPHGERTWAAWSRRADGQDIG